MRPRRSTNYCTVFRNVTSLSCGSRAGQLWRSSNAGIKVLSTGEQILVLVIHSTWIGFKYPIRGDKGNWYLHPRSGKGSGV